MRLDRRLALAFLAPLAANAVLLHVFTGLVGAPRALRASIGFPVLIVCTLFSILPVFAVARRLERARTRARMAALEEARAELEARVAERTAELAQRLEELREAQRRLLVSDRFAALGTLAAGVAHEVNNPLCAVLGNLGYVAGELTDVLRRARAAGAGPASETEADLLAALDETRAGAQRVAVIIRDLRVLGQMDATSRSRIDPGAALEAALGVSGHLLRKRARIVTDLGLLPVVNGNVAQLGQAFLNLLVASATAVEHRATEREATVHVTSRTLCDGRAGVEIRHDGVALSAEVQDHLFDPFFAAHPAGAPPGMSLAVAHAIVTGLGGTLEVASDPGEGTRIEVALPPAEAPATRSAA